MGTCIRLQNWVHMFSQHQHQKNFPISFRYCKSVIFLRPSEKEKNSSNLTRPSNTEISNSPVQRSKFSSSKLTEPLDPGAYGRIKVPWFRENICTNLQLRKKWSRIFSYESPTCLLNLVTLKKWRNIIC